MSDWNRKRQSGYDNSYGRDDDNYRRQRDNVKRRSRDTRYIDKERRNRSRSHSRDGYSRSRGQSGYTGDSSSNRPYSSSSYGSASGASYRDDQQQYNHNNQNNNNRTRYSQLSDDNYYQQQQKQRDIPSSSSSYQQQQQQYLPDHLKDKLSNHNDMNIKTASYAYKSVPLYNNNNNIPSIMPRRKGDEIVFRLVQVAPHILEKNFIKKRLTKLFPTLCELEFDDPRTRDKIYLEFRLETSIPPVLLSGGKIHAFDKFQLHLLTEEEMKNEDPSIVRQDGYKDASANLEKIDKLDPYVYCMENALGMCDSKDRCGLKHLGTKIERDRLLNRMKSFPCKDDPCYSQNCVYIHDHSRFSAPNPISQALSTTFTPANPQTDPSLSYSNQDIIQRVYEYIYNRPDHKILSTEIKNLYEALPFCAPLIKGAALKFFGKHPDKFATSHDGLVHTIFAIVPVDNNKIERGSFIDSQSNNLDNSKSEPPILGFLAPNDSQKKSGNQNYNGPKSWSDVTKNSPAQPIKPGFDQSHKESSLDVEQFIKEVSKNSTPQTKTQQQPQMSNSNINDNNISDNGVKTSSPTTIDNSYNNSSYPSSDRMPPPYPTYMDSSNINAKTYGYGSGYLDDRSSYGSMQMNTNMMYPHQQPYMQNPTMTSIHMPMHMAHPMMRPQQTPPLQVPQPTTQFICQVCRTMFRDEAHLMKHMNESQKHKENLAKRGLL